jgi:hypothetical protein
MAGSTRLASTFTAIMLRRFISRAMSPSFFSRSRLRGLLLVGSGGFAKLSHGQVPFLVQGPLDELPEALGHDLQPSSIGESKARGRSVRRSWNSRTSTLDTGQVGLQERAVGKRRENQQQKHNNTL